jgi:hypothetical protein
LHCKEKFLLLPQFSKVPQWVYVIEKADCHFFAISSFLWCFFSRAKLQGLVFRGFGHYSLEVDIVIEFNPSAFKHGATEADIRWAFDTARYDGWYNGGEDHAKDKYLLIGFDQKGNPLEILYNFIDDKSINVFHAMKCRNIYFHLIEKEE